MKLITNSAEIKVTENEDGSKSFQGIGSEVGVENRNGIILTPNCIEFARERYPLLYEHGAGSSEVIGDAKVYYDLASNKYLTDFTLYDNAPNINKAVENGAFDSLSIAYYITDYTFDDNDALVVNKAQFKELSLIHISRPRPAAGRKKALFAAKSRQISPNLAKSRQISLKLCYILIIGIYTNILACESRVTQAGKLISKSYCCS